MVKKYAELYLDARRALLPKEGQFASNIARELVCAASGKTPEQVEAQLCALIPKEKWAESHHWLIWHGRRVCDAKRPNCKACTLAAHCPGKKEEE